MLIQLHRHFCTNELEKLCKLHLRKKIFQIVIIYTQTHNFKILTHQVKSSLINYKDKFMAIVKQRQIN